MSHLKTHRIKMSHLKTHRIKMSHLKTTNVYHIALNVLEHLNIYGDIGICEK